MNNRLPVYIENNELPYMKKDNKGSYGYVNILYILSLIITFSSMIIVMVIS